MSDSNMEVPELSDISVPDDHEWYFTAGLDSNHLFLRKCKASKVIHLVYLSSLVITGSNMNPVCLQLRDLVPVRSYAVRVPNWRLVFKGSSGLATIDYLYPEAYGAHIHGVVHLMKQADMKVRRPLSEVEIED